jgi:putative ATP-dependent endonuclease of the OLD family
MRLAAIQLHNFRRYKGDTVIPVGKLTALIGKNDIGKSSILEAAGIFLNAPGLAVDGDDLCIHAADQEVWIGCTFEDLPDELVIDATAPTNLRDEHLLNGRGQLEVYRVWEVRDRKAKEKSPFALAHHPTGASYADLLQLKITALRQRASTLNVDLANVDARTCAQLRKAIWSSAADLERGQTKIQLNQEDAKAIWLKLQELFPTFALFKADRPSTDQDGEVQDPMKLAVKQALAETSVELGRVKDAVQAKAIEVAQRTIEKLRELDPELAEQLAPEFSKEPKWDSAFSLSLSGEGGIPLNKRGSGFRRLVLLSFFRAEAERRQRDEARGDVIYAVEEPEASQHPDNQRMVMQALKDLSDGAHCQVLLTTHVPALAEVLPTDSLRHVLAGDDNTTRIDIDGDGMIRRIADDLGVVPDKRVKVIVCMEGPHDITCLGHFARTLHAFDNTLPEVSDNPAVIFMPLGGSTLRDWVTKHYLSQFGVPEFHIYDRGTDPQPKYAAEAASVNARTDGSKAVHTTKGELENYLHEDAIRSVRAITVQVSDTCDVPLQAAEAVHCADPAAGAWDEVDPESKKRKMSHAKRWLNDQAAAAMTRQMLVNRSAEVEIVGWLRTIGSFLS